jgi:ribulose kinase
VIGPLTATAAAALGLRPGTPVVQGAIDAHAAAIGMNTLQPGQLGIILGTSSCHMAMSDTGVFGTGSWGPYHDALMPGLWTLEGGQTATGSIVRWVEQTAGGGRSLNELDVAAAAVGPGASGLLALDDWQGNRSPRQDPLARGVFVGLTLSHNVGHLLRAVYEATTFGTRHILEDMVAHGFHPREMVISGGGVQSRLWLQLHADICNLPVVLTAEPEATALGAVICAAVGAGAVADLRSAAAAMVRERARIEPDLATRAQYDSLYGHYLATYDALRPVMHALASGTEYGHA